MFKLEKASGRENFIQEILELNQKLGVEKINLALDLIESKYKDAARKSGQKVVEHLQTVALYAARLRLDTDGIVAALLHEIIDSELASLDEIDKKFGTAVAFILDGLSHIKHTSSGFVANTDTGSFRKMLISATEDIRVLVIRLCDKLENLNTIAALPKDLQEQQAKKIQLVYAPLCEYLGLGQLLEIFHNKSLAILEPDVFDIIDTTLRRQLETNKNMLEKLAADISDILHRFELANFDISYRAKNTFSAYNKVKKKFLVKGNEITQNDVEKLRDLFGIRVILEDVSHCYMLLGVLHQEFEYVPEEFDDYIVKPKASGYRSIHTVLVVNGIYVEVQIRTKAMHEYNEFGPASHLAYKLMGNKMGQESFTWTKELVGWQQEKDEEKYKIKAFSESVFVFTPKGQIIQLPKGSTPLDFAFAIHTDLGIHYSGAKVNGTMRAMNWQLETGDLVEILQTKKVSLSRDWLQMVKSSDAKTRIRKYFRNKV